MFIDSHCHINSLSPFQIQEVTGAAGSAYAFVDSSIDLASSRKSLELSAQYPFVYSALGFHPFSVAQFDDATVARYQQLITENKKIIAVGEIGLDAQADSPDKQERVLKEFINLAINNGLPVEIHNRTEGMRIFDILDEFYHSYETIVFHCFSYQVEALKKIADRGGFASFSLNILRKKSDLLSSLKSCPRDNLLLETDSPYMKINRMPSSPLNIKEVYEFAANIRGVSVGDLQNSVINNSRRVFKILE
jgi:TatD DNase family protein